MKYLAPITLLLPLVMASSITLATSSPSSLDERQQKQKVRIAQGINSGELTGAETVRLAKGQAQLERLERRADADGLITAEEQARLDKKAERESRKIYRQKHDHQSRD